MNKMTQAYASVCKELETQLSERLQRTLSLKEQNAIRNAGSLMMLEVIDRNFGSCQTNKEIEELFTQLYELNRLESAIEQLKNSYKKQESKLRPVIEVIESHGNCLDVMEVVDFLAENEESNGLAKLTATRKLNGKLKLKLKDLTVRR